MKRTILLYVWSALLLASCIGAGTHGSIEAYEYSVSKSKLEEAVEKVIKESSNIRRDTVANYMVDITGKEPDTIYSDHYNDGKRYFTINIFTGSGENEFIFHFTGREEDWATDTISTISISYAFDENDRGGSEGNGGVTWYKPFLKKKLVTVFEKEFLEKLNKELGVRPTETD